MTSNPRIAAWMRQGTLIAFSLLFALPFLGMMATSLKEEAQIQTFGGFFSLFWPRPIRWENYTEVFEFVPFARYILNTAWVTLMSVIGTALSCSCAAYAFGRLRWPGRDVFFAVLIATMMLPAQVTLVPLFLVFSGMGWANSFKPLWVPSFFGVAFYIFLLRQFFLTIPRDLEEAAEIDGCGYGRIFWTILMPLMKPALLAVMVFQFLATWNDFVGPMVYLNRPDLLTLAIGLQAFRSLHGAQWGLLLAASTIMTLPVVILFFAAQKYFVEGITLTGLKS
ncbi:MAG: carbohydrate ABC transporter permease [Candidatus Sumerlaeaceae bacterium]|nr:carbohydrate ABC transporter permease [Candidatus Sumerlaeaceae bacterium]